MFTHSNKDKSSRHIDAAKRSVAEKQGRHGQGDYCYAVASGLRSPSLIHVAYGQYRHAVASGQR